MQPRRSPASNTVQQAIYQSSTSNMVLDLIMRFRSITVQEPDLISTDQQDKKRTASSEDAPEAVVKRVPTLFFNQPRSYKSESQRTILSILEMYRRFGVIPENVFLRLTREPAFCDGASNGYRFFLLAMRKKLIEVPHDVLSYMMEYMSNNAVPELSNYPQVISHLEKAICDAWSEQLGLPNPKGYASNNVAASSADTVHATSAAISSEDTAAATIGTSPDSVKQEKDQFSDFRRSL